MNGYLFTFRSITPAQRGEAVLRRRGVDAALRRTPRSIADKGCGYALRVPVLQLNRAVSALREQNVPFQRVYLQTGEQLEEVWV